MEHQPSQQGSQGLVEAAAAAAEALSSDKPSTSSSTLVVNTVRTHR